MRRLLPALLPALLAASLAAPALAVGPPVRPQRLRAETLSHAGQDRTYRLRHPRRHGPPYTGLLMVLHGLGGARLFRRCDFQRLEERAGYARMLVAYPEAAGETWRDPGSLDPLPDDLGFLLRLQEKLVADHAIPPDRVFLVALGPGGRLAFQLRDARPAQVRAAAVVGMGPDPTRLAQQAQLRTGRVVPTLLLRGTEDPWVPFGGGPLRLPGWRPAPVAGARETLRAWAAAGECLPRAEYRSLPRRRRDRPLWMRRTRFHGCRGGAELVLYEQVGGGHGWPGCHEDHRQGTRGGLGWTYLASDMIWDFFLRHGVPPLDDPRPEWERRPLDWVVDRGLGDPLWEREAPSPLRDAATEYPVDP